MKRHIYSRCQLISQDIEIGNPINAIPTSKFTNLKNMNERDLENQVSNNLNWKGNYANQPSLYVNQSNIESSCYTVLQDGGWTKNDYQHLQG